MRIAKYMAAAGVASRRKSEELIKKGIVKVNGRFVYDPATNVDPEVDQVYVSGQKIRIPDEKIYIMLNKPVGCVSTCADDKGRRTVLDYVKGIDQRIYPIGRLDFTTEGLLLLTNNGPLAHRLLAPRNHVDKTYFVRVDGELDGADAAAFAAGMMLEDGLACLPAGLEVLEQPDTALVTLHEGKYHQIKRMLAARGKPVVYLKRLTMGPLMLDPALERGEWRPLSAEEVAALRQA